MGGLNADFLSSSEIASIGFMSCGVDVRIHRTAVLVNCHNISLSSHIRVDPFCILSAGKLLSIGRNVHIAAYSSILGSGEVELNDFVGLSQGCRIIAASDDYSGDFLTNPTVAKKYTKINSNPIRLGRHVLMGTGSVVLPGCNIGDGAIIGALSLVNRHLEGWKIYAGVPAKPIRERKRDVLRLEAKYLEENP